MSFTYGQIHDKHIRLEVLKHGDQNRRYKFIDKVDGTTTLLTYLGEAKTSTGSTYKVLTSVWQWGLSHRATSRILIYDDHNRYVGQYDVSMTYDLPNTLKDNQLIFLNSDNVGSGCDLKLVSYIDLSKGLPKQIFIRCEGESGDLYPLEKQ